MLEEAGDDAQRTFLHREAPDLERIESSFRDAEALLAAAHSDRRPIHVRVVQLEARAWLRSPALTAVRDAFEQALLLAMLRDSSLVNVQRLLLYDLPSDVLTRQAASTEAAQRAAEREHGELSRDLHSWHLHCGRSLAMLGLRGLELQGRWHAPDYDLRVVILGRADDDDRHVEESSLPQDGVWKVGQEPRFGDTWTTASRNYLRPAGHWYAPPRDIHPAGASQL